MQVKLSICGDNLPLSKHIFASFKHFISSPQQILDMWVLTASVLESVLNMCRCCEGRVSWKRRRHPQWGMTGPQLDESDGCVGAVCVNLVSCDGPAWGWCCCCDSLCLGCLSCVWSVPYCLRNKRPFEYRVVGYCFHVLFHDSLCMGFAWTKEHFWKLAASFQVGFSTKDGLFLIQWLEGDLQ